MTEDTAVRYLKDRVAVHGGDSAAVIKALFDNSIDAVVTDPPYALVSITKRFGADGAKAAKAGSVYARASSGFMGRKWDTGETAFSVEFWREVLRVLKPGGHVVAFGGTRSYHRLACAIEDAGFEIRDCLMWIYGTGFPKSHDVSKSIDKAAGATREVVSTRAAQDMRGGNLMERSQGIGKPTMEYATTKPATDEARTWEGWGTALKPAWEPICLARKPLSEPTVAANVLKWGTGAINIGACRVGTDGGCAGAGAGAGAGAVVFGDGLNGTFAKPVPGLGRWPANILIDDSQEVRDAFPETTSGAMREEVGAYDGDGVTGFLRGRSGPSNQHGDSGSAARFFYSAKADSDDRLASRHPTIKPLALIQWLVKLITPPGGTILDCFAGTGTTGEAAWREGFNAVLIEREAEYLDDIARRMKYALGGLDERKHVITKAKGLVEPPGPLFAAMEGT